MITRVVTAMLKARVLLNNIDLFGDLLEEDRFVWPCKLDSWQEN